MPKGIYIRKNNKWIQKFCQICNKIFPFYPRSQHDGKYCSRKCFYDSMIGRVKKRISIQERFEKFLKANANGCWIFTGGKARFGYGIFYTNPKCEFAHRVAWKLYCGPIPWGKCVLHKCDVPSCCNPDHLWLGDGFDNQRDCTEKGRRISVKGEQHPHSKLTNQQVKEIKNDLRGPRKIARDYGVSHSTIGDIKYGRTWKHLF